jgi:hypothetical protein
MLLTKEIRVRNWSRSENNDKSKNGQFLGGSSSISVDARTRRKRTSSLEIVIGIIRLDDSNRSKPCHCGKRRMIAQGSVDGIESVNNACRLSPCP